MTTEKILKKHTLITDTETNTVFVSSLLNYRYPVLYESLSKILLKENIELQELKNTKDIWCRDYMPVQLGEHDFLQFIFHPDYLKAREYRNLRTRPALAYPEFLRLVRESDITLDGGNIVKYKNKVIITNKVIDENSGYSKTDLLDLLKEELEVDQVIVIPQLPDDITGHSDGMVRWIDEKNVLVNDFRKYHRKGYAEQLKKSLETQGLRITLMPWDGWKNKEAMDDTGDYINFLHVGNLIILPEFDTLMDSMAKSVIRHCYPKAKVYGINCRQIAREGGLLNCCTWNIKMNTKSNYYEL